jgi:drug/metabolite transporter (DMT)-like permease
MKTPSTEPMRPLEWILLLTLSVLWGGSFFFGKVALAQLPPFTIVFCRVSFAAAVLNLVLVASGRQMPRGFRVWGAFLVMGILNNVIPFSLIFWGQTYISSSLAAILNATTPLWTVVLAHFLTKDERMTLNRLSGVVLGLIGVIVMIGPSALGGLGLNIVAQLGVVGAALSYGLAAIFGRRFTGIPPLITAAGQLTGTTVIMLPLTVIVDKPWTLLPVHFVTWGAVLGLAVLCTSIAYIIYFRILATAGAANVLLVTFLIPVSALLLGATMLGERPDLRHFIGLALIGFGLAAMDGRVVVFWRKRVRCRPVAECISPGYDHGMGI